MFNQPDPSWFYALSPTVQDMWIDHVRNLRSGAYETRQAPRKRTHAENMQAQREALQAARERRGGGDR